MAREFYFEDLLTYPIEVDGVEIDATVMAVVCSERDKYYIDSLDFERVFICIADHRFELTAQDFRERHSSLHDKFIKKISHYACEKALDMAEA